MRIQKTDVRARKWENLKEATGETTVSKALDTAADYYLRMRGDTAAVPTGAIFELMQLAETQGSVTAAEIADVLDSDELPVKFELRWSVGE
jgi:hypothetical protein